MAQLNTRESCNLSFESNHSSFLLTYCPEEIVVLDEQPYYVGGLGCHGNVVHAVSGGKLDEQVWGNHHGDVGQVHLVAG